MQIRNLTPHAITILREGDDAPLVIAPDPAGPARCAVRSVGVVDHPASLRSIVIIRSKFGEVSGLPAPEPGVLLVVAGLVLDHPSSEGRTDLAAPGELVRGTDGQPTGCRGLRVR